MSRSTRRSAVDGSLSRLAIGAVKAKWRGGVPQALLLCVAVLVVLRYPGFADDGFWRAIAEVDLIVVGVLAGLLLLPEPKLVVSDQLDFRKAPPIVGALDEEVVTDLIRDILAIRSSPQIAEFATRHGWKPIVDLGSGTRNAFRSDLQYEVELSRSALTEWAEFYSVHTTTKARRILPPGEPWISFARTITALRSEYREQECIGRELVLVPGTLWEEFIAKGRLVAHLSVGPTWQCTDPTLERVNPDLVRFRFPEPPAQVRPDPVVTEHTWFPAPRSVSWFPVKFSDYFCMGQTRVRFRINDPDVSFVDALVSFAGDTELDPSNEGVSFDIDDEGGAHRVEVRTSDDVVLWPGSGVSFVWSHQDVPVTSAGQGS